MFDSVAAITQAVLAILALPVAVAAALAAVGANRQMELQRVCDGFYDADLEGAVVAVFDVLEAGGERCVLVVDEDRGDVTARTRVDSSGGVRLGAVNLQAEEARRQKLDRVETALLGATRAGVRHASLVQQFSSFERRLAYWSTSGVLGAIGRARASRNVNMLLGESYVDTAALFRHVVPRLVRVRDGVEDPAYFAESSSIGDSACHKFFESAIATAGELHMLSRLTSSLLQALPSGAVGESS